MQGERVRVRELRSHILSGVAQKKNNVQTEWEPEVSIPGGGQKAHLRNSVSTQLEGREWMGRTVALEPGCPGQNLTQITAVDP